MSTVAWDGKILAADKQATVAELARSCSKIRKLPNGDILAVTGTLGPCLIMMQWYEDGADISTYPPCQKEKDDWGRLIVAKPTGEILEYEQYPVVMMPDPGKHAWGSGRDYALGAMAMGANAIQAVEIASRFDVNTGCGLEFYEI